MSLAFLRFLGGEEGSIEEAKVHLRKAKLIFDLGKNTLALARLPKDYEVSRNILRTAENHLAEAGRAIAEALRGNTPVDEVLPLFRSLVGGVSASMTRIRQSGLEGLGNAKTEDLQAFAKTIESIIQKAKEGLAPHVVSALLEKAAEEGKTALDPQSYGAIFPMIRQAVLRIFQKASLEVSEKIPEWRTKDPRVNFAIEDIERSVASLFPKSWEGELEDPDEKDIQHSIAFISRAEATIRSLPPAVRSPLGRMVKIAHRVIHDAIQTYSLKEKTEERVPSEIVFERVKSHLKLKPGDPVPPDLYKTLVTRLEARFPSRFPFPDADAILSRTEELISRSGNILKQASRLDPESLKYLKEDFKASSLLLKAKDFIDQASSVISRIPAPENPTVEEIKSRFPGASQFRISHELARETVRRRKVVPDLIKRVKEASINILKLSNQSNFLRTLVLGLSKMEGP